MTTVLSSTAEVKVAAPLPANTRRPEWKHVVDVGTVFVATVALALINAFGANSALFGPVPAWAQGLLVVAVPTTATYLTGYLTRHTPREGDDPDPGYDFATEVGKKAATAILERLPGHVGAALVTQGANTAAISGDSSTTVSATAYARPEPYLTAPEPSIGADLGDAAVSDDDLVHFTNAPHPDDAEPVGLVTVPGAEPDFPIYVGSGEREDSDVHLATPDNPDQDSTPR